MNKKTIIQIIVIVCAFGAAAVVLYNGFFKNGNQAAFSSVVQNSDSAQKIQQVLPYGNSLDFDLILYQKQLQYHLVDYPKLDPKSEVGIPQSNLITPLTTNTK